MANLAGHDEPRPSLPRQRRSNGRTLGLHVGDRFVLKLGEDFNWTPTVADQSVVQRVPGVLVVRGAQGIYEAERLGETDLTAVGTGLRLALAGCFASLGVLAVAWTLLVFDSQ